jgi:hypothetical protein
MRRIYFLILLCFMSITMNTITAQNSCNIELEDAILQLVQAQRAADTGDTLLATSILESVQSTLDTYTNGCDSVQLSQKYTSPDESLTFEYPEGWTIRGIDGGPIIVASSPTLIDVLDNDLPESIPVGDAAIAILTQPAEDTFDDSVDDLMEEILDEFRILGEVDDSITKGRRVVSMSVAFNENVSGRISLIDYGDADDPVAMLVFGLADSASLPIIEAYTDALVKSIQYPPVASLRNIGVALESLSYDEVVNLTEESDITPSIPVSLSPDGTTIAWQGDEELCLQVLNQAEDCTALPENFSTSTPLLQWSPDGRYIAFQENALLSFVDADMWRFDVEERTVVNLTDDGDAEFSVGPAETDTWMDTVMTWGPDNQIYLLRTAIEEGKESDDRTYELLRIDPDTGETSLIQDLTGIFLPFTVSYQGQYSLDGVMSVSPDATQLAISVLEFERDSTNNGIWLIDLSGSNDPQHIATTEQFMAGYSSDIFEDISRYAIESIAWDADGTGLYAYTYALSSVDLFQASMVYHMDLASSDIVPLVDLSSYTKGELLDAVLREADDSSPLAEPEFIPTSPILSPDYRGVIVTNGNRTAILTIPFDGQFGDPVTLYEADDMELFGRTSMMGNDGTALIAGNLFIQD